MISHSEASKNGYASNHKDCDHWLKRFGRTMDDERAYVKKLLTVTASSPSENGFKVLVTCSVSMSEKVQGINMALSLLLKK